VVLDRKTLEPPLSSFGQAGDEPGEFYVVHNMVAGPAGDPYTAEVNVGRRFQNFNFLAVQPVSSEDSPISHVSPGSQQLTVPR
jgi:hypothetical protein